MTRPGRTRDRRRVRCLRDTATDGTPGHQPGVLRDRADVRPTAFSATSFVWHKTADQIRERLASCCCTTINQGATI